MKKNILFALLLGLSASAMAKSVVLTLADKAGTQVYYRITTALPPQMVLCGDGTITMCGREFELSGVKSFRISDTDYSGEKGTVDGVVSITAQDVLMQGPVQVYGLDGRLLQTGAGRADINALPAGTYVISNGVSTLKLLKK